MNSRLARIVFCTLLLLLTLIAYYVPYYDWDLVAYVGSAIALDEHDARTIQRTAYDALRRELPQDDYQDVASGSDFRRDVAANPDHFHQQLRFYQIRPLYIWIVAALHGIGIPYVADTRLISAASFLAMGILLFLWARRYTSESNSAWAVLLLLCIPVFFTSARTGSPDAISALIVLLGTFQIAERKHLISGILLFFISLFLRTDNVIFVFLLLASMAIPVSESRRRRVFVAILALAAVGVVSAINHTQHSYSWSVLMQNTATPIVNPAEVAPRLTAADYFDSVHDMIDEARENSVLAFPFIALITLLSRRTPTHLKRLVTVVLLSWLAHAALFPHIEDRYFIAGAAIIGIAAISSALSWNPAEPLHVAR
jgi:4-amino-4-deoxy-L-arabinose transferase-like glycosyltransferase